MRQADETSNPPGKPDRPTRDGRTAVYRHPMAVRATHWAWALSIVVLLGSGLQILNAHPALYWGATSRFERPWAAIGADEAGQRGWVRIGGAQASTTGWLGVSKGPDGTPSVRALPRWATLPAELDLGAGRQWHFAFAWLLALSAGGYLAYSVASGRLRRDLLPSRRELAGLGRSVIDHLRLRFAHGEDARGYNVLQKLTYLLVMVAVVPLMLCTGLAMSPALDARMPWLTEVFSGRQSARSIHFLGAGALLLFLAVHLVMVVAAGPINEMRSMLSGWFVIGSRRREASHDQS